MWSIAIALSIYNLVTVTHTSLICEDVFEMYSLKIIIEV